MLDIFVYKYSDRWTWKYATGIAQCRPKKLMDEAISHARQKNPESVIYVEGKDGKFKKLKNKHG